jgi:hypothetical protein
MTQLYKAFCFLFLTLSFTPAKLNAQVIENTINLYGINFPQEKIHIHFDKEAYLPGETIWFKAYLFEEYLPSARSTNFYASLYDEEGKLIQQQLCPIFNGTTDGHFQIPDSLKSRQLICRAYTTWMLNFDTTFLYTKAIKLINSDAKADGNKSIKTVSLQFFPEGGDLIEGTRNTIAFKANYNNGLPFDINGVIKKQQTGEVIMPVRSSHDGMGRFDLEIQPNEKFYVEWMDDKGALKQNYLPNAKPAGVSLKLIQLKNDVIFNIVNKLPKDSLHILIHLYQKVFYKTDIAVAATEPYTATVPVGSLPTGIMQLTVFDANWQPVAERVAFINNNNYSPGVTIKSIETSTKKRAKNTIEIEVTDTIPSNMSLSITDAELNNETGGATIVSDLLLSADVKGYINDPAYYFTSNTDASLKENLDLVMLTHGWRRYNWDNMLAAKRPAIKYPVDNFLTAYGQVSKAAMQKLDKDELVNLIVKTKDSTQNFYFVKPGADGVFKQEGLVFYDTAKVLYSFNKNKLLNPQVALGIFNSTYNQPTAINDYGSYFIPDTIGVRFNQIASIFQYYIKEKAKQEFNKEKTLQSVIVKNGGWHNWKNDPMLKMDERYTDFAFRGGATAWSFDVVHDEMATAKGDIYNYMLGKVPGISIIYPPGGGGKKFNGIEILFLNEVEIDDNDLATVNIGDVAYIKLIQHLAIRRGLPTALAIYLKKGDDLIDHRTKDSDLKSVKIPGYSPLKEFYAPDYSQSNTGIGNDARTTLLWQPYILTDAINRKVPVVFYNNDFSKKLKLILEGVNDEGKIIHVEKIIE